MYTSYGFVFLCGGLVFMLSSSSVQLEILDGLCDDGSPSSSPFHPDQVTESAATDVDG